VGTRPTTFSIAQLDDFRSHDKNASYHLELPTFQRGLVWPLSKKTSLIHSISSEFPIGALLMYEKVLGPGQRIPLLQVIDGLQRSTAILDYLQKPLQVAPVAEEFIDHETYEDLVELLSETGIETKPDILRGVLKQWADETKTDRVVDGFQASSIRKKIEEHFSIEFDGNQRDTIENVLAEEVIQKVTDIFQRLKNYQIPVILYSGPEENLPEIFESLNAGTPLTKYDKFGAAWSGQTTLTKNALVRDAVAERYKVYVDRDWEVANFDATTPLGEKDLNLFEYLVGLGHLLADKNNALFPEASYENEAPSYAFALATLCHGLRLGEMDKLPTKVNKAASGEIDLTAFEAAIIDAAKVVNDSLDQYLSLKLNMKTANTRFIPHSDLQVISLIARVAIEKYDPANWQPRTGGQTQQLVKNIQTHYFYDILKENWKGSGDSTAYRRVWEEDVNKNLTRASYYLQTPTSEEFGQSLDDFHSSELKKSQVDRPNISIKTKVLMRVLYADIISHWDNKSVQFEIEHLFPVKGLTDLIVASSAKTGLPISAFGNLAILSKDDNVIKGKNFIGDFVIEKPSKVTDLEKVKKYVITPLDKVKKDELLSTSAYMAFCVERFAAQKQVIMANLGF
jgi:hypothetical protein